MATQEQMDELTAGLVRTAAQLVQHASDEHLAGFLDVVRSDLDAVDPLFDPTLTAEVLREGARRLRGGERVPMPSKSR